MRKLDLSGNHKRHANNIKLAGKDRVAEKARLISALLQDYPAHNDGIIGIYTTGSDGRYENKAHPGVKSNLELQMYLQHSLTEAEVERFKRITKDRVDFALENLEIKNLEVDSIALYKGNPDLIFPTRAWDSVVLFGEEADTEAIRKLLSGEIMDRPKLSLKFADRLRTHKVIMETGEDRFRSERIKSYNLQEGVFYYNPESSQFAVKNGPLRYVQYLLALALMRYIRDKKEHPNFLGALPTNIIDRLEFIAQESLSRKNREEIDTIRDIYAFFLYLYHEVQYRHFSESETDFHIEDRDKLRDIRDMLEYLRNAVKVADFFPAN